MQKNNSLTIPQVLIIIPCYNEENRLQTKKFIEFSNVNQNIHFLFVDDGSQDKTSILIKELSEQEKNFFSLILEKNVGKGEAIRSGVLSIQNELTNYDFIGYLDADLSIPLLEINNFLYSIRKNENIKFIMGIRVVRLGVKIHQKTIRRYLGRIFALMAGMLLKETVYDTQCGSKLIHSTLIQQLFKDEFISNWLFDIELIARFKIHFANQENIILEHPLEECCEVIGSKLKIKDFLSVPYEMFLIWNKYHKQLKKTTH